jgi:integrase
LVRISGSITNTIGIYLRSLRAVINFGIANGLFAKEYYPFGRTSHGKYQIPAAQNKKRALIKTEVDAIKALAVKPGSRKELARDFWLFSYYANGCNIKDIVHLKWRDIDWKEGVIQFVRKKTERANKANQVQITAVINPHLTEVIQRRGIENPAPNNYVFDIIRDDQTAEQQHKHIQEFVRRINIGLKQIADELELSKNLTTYTARHSHAYALLMGGASLEVIMDQFKHSSMKTTMSYIDSIDNEKRKDIAKLL